MAGPVVTPYPVINPTHLPHTSPPKRCGNKISLEHPKVWRKEVFKKFIQSMSSFFTVGHVLFHKLETE